MIEFTLSPETAVSILAVAISLAALVRSIAVDRKLERRNEQYLELAAQLSKTHETLAVVIGAGVAFGAFRDIATSPQLQDIILKALDKAAKRQPEP